MMGRFFAKYQSIGLITLSLMAGAIITFIALPILTRLYSVQDFGAYGIALAVVSVLSTVANFRLDQAILVAEELDKKSLIFEGAVFSTIIAVISAVILTVILNVEMGLAIASGVLANTLIQSIYNYQFAAHKEYFCAGLNIFRSTIVVAVQLNLPLLMQISLVNSYNLSSILIIVVMLLYILKYQLYQVSWKAFKSYKDFIYANTPHALLNSFSHNLPYYVVSHFLGLQAIGFYAIVERTLRVPINLISQTLRQFFIRKFKDTESSQVALKSSILLSLVSLPLFAAIFVLPESLYLWVFGNEWVGISQYFKILALGYWAIFCNPPSSAYLIAKRDSHKLFKLQIWELLIKFSLFVLLYFYVENKIYILLAVPASLILYNFSILYQVWRTQR